MSATDQSATVNEVNGLVEKAMNAVRNSVGYAEVVGENRRSFEAGARVALAKMAILTISAIEAHRVNATLASASADTAANDLKTIAGILKRYE